MKIGRGRAGGGRVLTSLLVAGSLAFSGCVWILQHPDVRSLDPAVPVTVHTPVKAHLKDGSTVVYAKGVTVKGPDLLGEGTRHDLTLSRTETVSRIAIDDVVAMESFRTGVDASLSVLASVTSTIGGVYGTAFLLAAIFGSCPTVYSGGGRRLEAETFSWAIVPLFEGRDLDRLHAQADPDGRVRLEVRNEALETHYINHLQLVEVSHDPGELALPDHEERAVIAGRLRPPLSARDRRGRDVLAVVRDADDDTFRSSEATLAAAGPADLEDWIDMSVPVPVDAGSVGLVFKARSSLLNTVLLYDVMLAAAGPRAIDWLGGLDQISEAVQMGRWCRRRMGLRVLVWRDGEYREEARIPDPGPIARHDVAAVVPVPPGEAVLKIRLAFVADAWRIDQVMVAESVRAAQTRTVPLETVTGPEGEPETAAHPALASPDGRYLQTTPGQRFLVQFDVGRERQAGSRTFLLSSQGYYTEWIRGAWLRPAAPARTFVPGDEHLHEAMVQWRQTRASFEARFDRQRVPVL